MDRRSSSAQVRGFHDWIDAGHVRAISEESLPEHLVNWNYDGWTVAAIGSLQGGIA
jgi:hypothetical protein